MAVAQENPREAVAIIGMACRFPGGAHSPEQLFENLEAGRSAWCEFPVDRLNIDGFYHPSSQRHESFNFRGAHFLTGNVAAFDAEFFSMSAAESNSTDVQQRMLLEVAYEAVENAGIAKETLAGSNASVYIGSFVKDYEQVSMRDTANLAPDCATGNGIAIMSNRISYFFDIHGPSMTIDTGCSASLICIHQAVQSLLNGESSLALAGGAGMILTPSTIMPMVSLGFLSPDGKCFTFDSRANGYGRGEGVGIIVLKRLSDAIRDNDTIRGVIRGTSTNQDGRTSGITMPSAEAQIVNIRKAYSSAGLGFDKTMFVECHGTGTKAGDPRELKAISEALCNERSPGNPMLVGSIKTNIGHLEGSAGVAGVIKAVMMIEHGKIPRHLNFESWNPDIDHQRLKVQVPLGNIDWPTKGLRRISVNSFGFGGSNAHAIIDDAAHYLEENLQLAANHNTKIVTSAPIRVHLDVKEYSQSLPYLFVLSANDQSGVGRVIDAHQEYLLTHASEPLILRDYAYTLFKRRSKLKYKAYVVARTVQDISFKLRSRKQAASHRSSKKALNIGFVFCGQGAQYPGMGMELCEFEPFRQSIEDAAGFLKEIEPTLDLMGTLRGFTALGRTDLCHPSFAQPATTALQVALVDLLTTCGVKPTTVVGHSSGEIAAAYAAGLISKKAALVIAILRGRVASCVQSKGNMLAVSLSPADAQKYIDRLRKGSVCVACINSPRSVTLSGDRDQVLKISELLGNDGITNKLLSVGVAYHSHHMQTVAHEYEVMLNDHLPRWRTMCLPNGATMFSSVLGRRVCSEELGPSYWVQNLVSPVEFVKAVSAMVEVEKRVRPEFLIEISPHSVLEQALGEIMGAVNALTAEEAYTPYASIMMKRKVDACSRSLRLLGELWMRGVEVQLDWLFTKESEHQPKCLVDLPTYPWNHSQTFWHESHLSKAHRFRKFGSHDFLGAMSTDSITPQEPRWRGFIDVTENPWIRHHKVQKKILYPAAGMVVMAVEAAKQVVDGFVDSRSDILDFEIYNFTIEEPMVVPESETRLEYNFNATRRVEHTTECLTTWRYSFTIYSLLDSGTAPPYHHTANARGMFAVRFKPRGMGDMHGRITAIIDSNPAFKDLYAAKSPMDFTDGMNPREFYERLNIIGLDYGRLFRNITAMSRAMPVPTSQSTKYCWTKVQIPNTRASMPEDYEQRSTIHPATLDAMFQSLFVLADEPMVPYYIESILIVADVPQGAGTLFHGYSEAKRKSQREVVSEIIMWHGAEGSLVQDCRAIVTIHGLTVTSMEASGKVLPDFLPHYRNLCSQIVWKEVFPYRRHDELWELRTFEDMLRMKGHERPGMRVLQVGGDKSVVALVLRVLGCDEITGLPALASRISKYLICDETDDVFQIAQTETPKELRTILGYELLKDRRNLAEALKQRQFDIVLGDYRMGLDRSILLQLLKPTGILFFTHENYSSNAIIDQSVPLGCRLSHSTDQDTWFPNTWHYEPNVDPDNMSTETALVLVPDDDDDCMDDHRRSAGILTRCLQKVASDLTVKVVTLTQLADLLEIEKSEGLDAFVISLVEFQRLNNFIYDISSDHYALIQRLLERSNKGLLWVTIGAQVATLPKNSPFLGWARTVRSEEPDKQIICLDVDDISLYALQKTGDWDIQDWYTNTASSIIADVFFRSFSSTIPAGMREVEYVVALGRLFIPRLEPNRVLNGLIGNPHRYVKVDHESPDNTALALSRGERAACEDVHFREAREIYRDLGPHEVLIEVDGCYLGPADVATLSGNSFDADFGHDVWGRVLSIGEQVSGISFGYPVVALAQGTVRTRVIVDRRFVKVVDDLNSFHYSPTCLITASYCLRYLCKGDILLVHGAAGAQGQAAIQIARHRSAVIFAVLSNDDTLLTARRPDADHALLGDYKLQENVMQATGGKGVDTVFNPTPNLRDVDFNMVRPYGRVIHLVSGKSGQSHHQVPSGQQFELVPFDFAGFLKSCPAQVIKHFEDVHHLPRLRPPPLPRRIHTFGQISLALKELERNPYVGVHELRRDQSELLPVRRTLKDTYPPAALSGDATYLIAGGLGGLGLDVVKWLADHGARHLTILSRSGVGYHGPAAAKCIDAVQQRGIEVDVRVVDICDWKSCSDTMMEVEKRHPIRGIIQAAAVIKDGIYQNLTYDDWKAVTRVKTVGSYNLHSASLTHCHLLDFFVFLSSAAGVIGNLGQANYAAGNAFQDALARHRCGRGMHSVSIDLGPVLGAGMVAEDEALWDMLRAGGFIGVRLEDFYTVLERAIYTPTPPSGIMSSGDDDQTKKSTNHFVCPAQVVMGVGTGGLVAQDKIANPFWTRSPLFSYLNRVDLPPGAAADGESGGGGPTETLRPALKAASSRAEAVDILVPAFIRALSEVMGKKAAEIDPDSILDDHGPDSLRMKEILDWFATATGVRISGINQMPIRSICVQVADLGGFGGED